MKQKLVLLAIAISLLPLSHARASTFVVTTLADSGGGSLRAAVNSANALPGSDTIRFQTGLQGTILLGSEILISDSVSIEGPGQGLLTVAGSASNRIFRLARSSGPRNTTVLSKMKFINGRASDGGAISATDENLIVRDAEFTGNASVSRGGAIHFAKGDLTLEDVSLVGNNAGPGNNNTGGAIDFSNGTLRMLRCVVRQNTASYGGGLRLGSPSPNLLLEDSLFLENYASYYGGAIEAGPSVQSFRVSRSAFVGNSSDQGVGAAVRYSGSDSVGNSPGVIENSTFSGNHTPHSNGRGILAITTGTLYLRNSTLAFNRTATGSAVAPNEGGAVWVGSASLHIDSTLFSQNTHGSGGALVDIAPTSYPSGVLNVSHSLMHSNPGGLINGINIGNQFNAHARLEPLTINAGPGFVPVHPIPHDSPAINAGSNPANLSTDQRGPGYPRTVDLLPCRSPSLARTDVGAFEYRTDTIFCHGFEN